MRIDRLGLVRLVEQAKRIEDFEEALAAAARELPADPSSIVEFFEVPTGGAFDVKPEKAIDYFARKGLKPTFSYADLMGEAHDHAFTVAKMMDVDLLGQMRASLDSALANGTPFKEWADEIMPTLQKAGWWGVKDVVDPQTGQVVRARLGTPWRLETIFRTNMQTAYAAAAWQGILAQADVAPFLMYDAIDDDRTRPLHAKWDRTVLPITSHWWSTHYPPNGWNCRCGVVQLTQSDVDALGLKVAVDPPKDGSYDWTNPRTGEELTIPNGIDPGFWKNAGTSYKDTLNEALKEKVQNLPKSMRDAQAEVEAKAQAFTKEAQAAALQAQQALAQAQGEAALARAKAIAQEKAKQFAAQAQLDAIAQGKETAGKGAKFKISALAQAKKSADWPELTPTQKLDKVNAIADELKAKQVVSQNLSLYKKAILEGKTPPPAAVKTFAGLPEGEAAAFLKKVEAEKAAIEAAKAKAAAEAAAKSSATLLDKPKLASPTLKKYADDVEAAVSQAEPEEIDAILALLKATPAGPEKDALVAYANSAKAWIEGGQKAATAYGTPPNTAALTQIGSQKGSNPGGLFQDPETGVRWYVKWPSDEEMIRNEVLAARLYALGGVDVPEVHIVTFNGRKAIASRFVDGVEKGSAAELAAAAGTAEGFAFDAWLANWDVAGLSFDNLLVKGGKAFRIDVGGSLRFKATGTLKPGASFGPTVGELESMKNAALNPQAAAVFGKIDPIKFEQGVKRLLAIDESQIAALVEEFGPRDPKARAELLDTLKRRRADIARRYQKLAPPSAEALKAAVADAAEKVQYARGLLDDSILTALKGIASRASKGAALEAKDVERVKDAAKRLAELKAVAGESMTAGSRDELLGYYGLWLRDLEEAVKPGAGAPAKWAGSIFKPHAGAIEIDPTRVKIPPTPEPGAITPPGEANKIIAQAFGSSASNLTVPRYPGAEELTKNMHGEHARVISCYTGSHYRALNMALRQGSASAPQKKVADLLNEALGLAPKYKGTVYRGLNLSGQERAAFVATHKAAFMTGGTVKSSQFSSTSRKASSAFGGDITLVIESKNGVHVAPISLHYGEDEVLFRSDAVFRVLGVDEKPGRTTIRLEEV